MLPSTGYSILPSVEVNLAKGEATSQTTTEHDGVSSLAVDGNYATTWRSGSCTHTAEMSNPNWIVDFQNHVIVNKVYLSYCYLLPKCTTSWEMLDRVKIYIKILLHHKYVIK